MIITYLVLGGQSHRSEAVGNSEHAVGAENEGGDTQHVDGAADGAGSGVADDASERHESLQHDDAVTASGGVYESPLQVQHQLLDASRNI
jgi:hypothetical protein